MKETLDFITDYTLHQNNGIIYAHFNIKEKNYLVCFIKHDTYSVNTIIKHYSNLGITPNLSGYEISFGLINDPIQNIDKLNIVDLVQNGKLIDIDSGTGDAFLVFAQVISIIKDFVKKFNPNLLLFGGRQNRRNIYSSLVKRVLKEFPQYKLLNETGLYIIYKKGSITENKLSEIFDSKVSYKKVKFNKQNSKDGQKNYDSTKQYDLNIKGLQYHIYFNRWSFFEIKKRLEHYFYSLVDSKNKKAGFEISFTLGNTYKLTGTGNAFTVLRNVGELLFKHIKKNPPFFFFEATQDEYSRVEAYSKMAFVIKKKFPKYEIYESYSSDLDMNIYFFYDPRIISIKDNY